MSISPESGIIKRAILGISLNGISGGISNIGMSLLAKYPLLASLLDSVTGATGTLTRSTVKHFANDSGVYSSAAIDSAAFTGSGVLIEPASTNINTYSYDISNAGYTKTRLTATTETVTGPDGATSAGELTVTATSASGAYFEKAYVISGSQQTIKFIVKYDTVPFLLFQAFDFALTNGVTRTFDISTGALGAFNTVSGTGWSIADASIIAKSGGYYEITLIVNTSGAGLYLYVYAANADSSINCTSGQKLKYYNLSIQENNTSSIRTTTTALTRTVDVLTVPTTGWLANDFAIYFKIDAATTDQESTTTLLLDYADVNNFISVIYAPIGPQFSVDITSGGTSVIAAVTTPILTTEMGILITYKDGLVGINANGSIDTTTGAITTLTHAATCSIGCNGTAQSFNGVMSYPKFINTSNVTLAQAEAL